MPNSIHDAAVMYRPKTVNAPGKMLVDLMEEHGMTRIALAQRKVHDEIAKLLECDENSV